MSALTGLDAAAAGIEERMALEGIEGVSEKELLILVLTTLRRANGLPRLRPREITAAVLGLLTAFGVITGGAVSAALKVMGP